MRVHDTAAIERISPWESNNMNFMEFSLEPAHVTLKIHNLNAEFAHVGAGDENVLARKAQRHSLHERLEILC